MSDRQRGKVCVSRGVDAVKDYIHGIVVDAANMRPALRCIAKACGSMPVLAVLCH
jgi:hypothetical protein